MGGKSLAKCSKVQFAKSHQITPTNPIPVFTVLVLKLNPFL